MKSLFYEKRAVTEMVAYVALIIVAFSISVLVYSYLQVQAPKDRPECPDGVALAVQEATCMIKPKPSGTRSELSLTLQNNGLRTLSGAYVRLGTTDQKIKGLVNENKIFFTAAPESGESAALAPGQKIIQQYQNKIAGSAVGTYAIEIEPVIGFPGNLALCEKALVTKTIECAYPQAKSVPSSASGTYTAGFYSWAQPRDALDFSVSVKPDDSYGDAVNYLEVAFWKKMNEGGQWEEMSWQSGETPPRTIRTYEVYEPDDTGRYTFARQFSRGEFKTEAYLVLYSGEKIKVIDSRPGYGQFPFEFVVYRFLDCQQSSTGVTYVPATVPAIYNGEIRESMTNTCGGSSYFYEKTCGYLSGGNNRNVPYIASCTWSCQSCNTRDGVGYCDGQKTYVSCQNFY